MSADELRRQEGEMSEQMFKLRFQWAMGQTETLKRMREIRKDRARLLTILHQKESEK
jgi:large subunit ribosomal protein L29